MRKSAVFSAVAALLIVLSTECGWALIQVPHRTSSWVNDYAGVIDEQTETFLEKFISSIKQQTPDPVEIIIATFPTLDGWKMSDFAFCYGEEWRTVKRNRRDNGVIILVAIREGQVVIGAGQNLKTIITADVTHDIIENTLKPAFVAGDYSGGIKRAVEKIAAILDTAEIPSGKFMVRIVRAVLLGLVVAGGILIARRRAARRAAKNT